MKKIVIKIFLLLFLFSTNLQAGGPWPQPKKKGYFKLSEWWLKFDQHYTDQGLIDPNVTNAIYNTTLYGEYGLTDRLTIMTNAVLFSKALNNNIISGTTNELIIAGESLNSIGDIDLGFKLEMESSTNTFD